MCLDVCMDVARGRVFGNFWACLISLLRLAVLNSVSKTRHQNENSFPDLANNFERELSIHNYLVKTCKFDIDHHIRAKNSKMDPENHSMIGPLIGNIGVCAGFAKAVQYLCLQLNIPVVCKLLQQRI